MSSKKRHSEIRAVNLALAAAASLLLAACAEQQAAPTLAEPGATSAQPQAATTQDAATRKEPIVAGRPARVFVFAGVSAKCEALPAPELTLSGLPSKGEVIFKPGQDTTIAASAGGTCVGSKAKGTGVYYTAKPGMTGTDRFSIQAKLSSGEVTSRVFDVTIVE